MRQTVPRALGCCAEERDKGLNAVVGRQSSVSWPLLTTIDWRLTTACQGLDKNSGYINATMDSLLFGYIFNKQEFPWLMSWMNYTGNPQAARGIEFSPQPFDISHRETVEAQEMFGSPAYRWLPAKSKIRTRFLRFYTKVPPDFPAS